VSWPSEGPDNGAVGTTASTRPAPFWTAGAPATWFVRAVSWPSEGPDYDAVGTTASIRPASFAVTEA
jgi:hypothetical protein